MELAEQFCRFMQRESAFLSFKPSQIAAASLLFTINFSQSEVIHTILAIDRIPKEELENLIVSELRLHFDSEVSNVTERS